MPHTATWLTIKAQWSQAVHYRSVTIRALRKSNRHPAACAGTCVDFIA